MRRTYLLAVALLFTLLIPLAARGDVDTGTFWAKINGENYVVGGGTGYGATQTNPLGGIWYEYPQPENSTAPPSWWNQWYYDGVFLEDHWKHIEIDFWAQMWVPEGEPTPPQNGRFDVIFNWTNPLWRNPNAPPLPPPVQGYDPEDYIVRNGGVEGVIIGNERQHFHYEWNVWDYNPMWVSVDVRGAFVDITGGVITHDCRPIPEPCTFIVWSLLGASGIGIGWLRRKRAG